MRSRWLLLLCLPWLTGCLLMSGPRETSDRVAEGGNVKVEFVSADGSEVRTIQGADGPATLAVTVFAQAEHGQLRIEVLDPQGSQTLVLEGISLAGGRAGDGADRRAGSLSLPRDRHRRPARRL